MQSSKLVIRMLRELCEDLSSIKRTDSEMKDTLIEIKNNLQGNNRRMEQQKQKIKSKICDIRKKKTTNPNNKE